MSAFRPCIVLVVAASVGCGGSEADSMDSSSSSSSGPGSSEEPVGEEGTTGNDPASASGGATPSSDTSSGNTTSPGETSEDAGETTEESTETGQPGYACPPPAIEGEWAGDLVIAAECEPPRLTGVVITGDLVLEPAARAIVLSPLSVQGGLTAGSGSRLVCDTESGENFAGFLTVAAPSTLQGSAGDPMVLERHPAVGSASCRASFDRVDADYVAFTNVHPSFEPGTEVHDSVFSMAGSGQSLPRMWIQGTGATFEYNRFERAILRGMDFTARNNEFVIPYVYGGVHVCQTCPSVASGYSGCSGDRSLESSVVLEDNVFDAYYGGPGMIGANVIEVDRDFGPIDFSGNYFLDGLPPDLDTWDGSTGGCADDSLGRYGGPVDLSPSLTEPPPVYGPRI